MKRIIPIILTAIIFIFLPLQAKADDIPYEIRVVIEEECAKKYICPEVVESIAYHESGFTPNIISASGDYYGLCQVGYKWNKDRMARLGVSKEELLTIRGNIVVAVDLLAELFETYEDIGDVLLAYGGFSQERKDRYHKDGTLPNYVNRVLDRARMYEMEHNK